MKQFFLFFILIPMGVFASESPVEHVIWDRVPIPFTIPMGAERMITFPDKVELHNTDPQLTLDKVNILNNAGTLYIRAKQTFSSIRVPVVLTKTGTVILLDISAKPNAEDTPVEVVLKDTKENSKTDSVNTGDESSINYTTLMRYAISHLYGPVRLIKEDMRINRVPMFTSKSVKLVYGDQVMSMPIASWHGGDLYVTAILVKNIWKQKFTLDPRRLQGAWCVASFYPTRNLDSIGSLRDRTTIFLISKLPFHEALHSMRGFE